MTATKEEITERVELIRHLEASVDIAFPEDDNLKFRDAVLKRLFTLLAVLERRQLTRIHEALCKLEYPRAIESNARIQVEAEIGKRHHLREVRQVIIPGPVKQDRPRPQSAPVPRAA